MNGFLEQVKDWVVVGERRFAALARRPKLATLVVTLLALGLRAALLPLFPIREPEIQDEFSYLLAACTFSSGRLTNPTHPMWAHFETLHVIHHPTYMSMYPPGQGAVLAAGKVLFGHPWYGVWLSVAAMCGAICWMLQGWLPPGWAFLGGLLVVFRFAIVGYWMNSYWGGAVAATGGALVLGSLPRIMRRPAIPVAMLMGLGLTLLANSRPYEGFVLSVPVLGTLSAWLVRKSGIRFRVKALRAVVPLSAVVVLGAFATGYYCWRVTGSFLRMPHQVNRATYATAQYFFWQVPKPAPAYRHKKLRDFYVGWELDRFQRARTLSGFARNLVENIVTFWLFYGGPATALLLGALPCLLRDRRSRLVIFILGLFFVGLSLNIWFQPHYAAPITGAVFLIFLQASRHLRVWLRWSNRKDLWAPRLLPVLFALLLAMVPEWVYSWCCTGPGNVERAKILAKLQQTDGRHLVLVQNGSGEDARRDWVYNGADIDTAKVVWARQMDDENNRKLIQYFKDRQVWVLEPHLHPARLSSYTPPGGR